VEEEAMTAVDPMERERRIGRRIIRARDIIDIAGFGRARVQVGRELVRGFRVLGFRGDEVYVFGAKTERRTPALRTFTIDRIGARHRAPEE
jgi:hypothetical protein